MDNASSHKSNKRESLRRHGTLHPHPERVKDPLFEKNSFFDPMDLLQVKYEMVRKVTKEDEAIAQVASRFGFSRPAFYEAKKSFKQEGLSGLMPKKRGPRTAHKLSSSIVTWLQEQLASTPDLTTTDLAELLFEKFGLRVHNRSIERALARSKKK